MRGVGLRSGCAAWAVLCAMSLLLAATPESSKLRGDLPRVLDAAAPGELVPVSVVLAEQLEPGTIARLARTENPRRAILERLKQHAARTQAPLLAAVAAYERDGLAARVRPLWLSSVVGLDATPAAIRALAARPEVAWINHNPKRPVFVEAPWKDAGPDAGTDWGRHQDARPGGLERARPDRARGRRRRHRLRRLLRAPRHHRPRLDQPRRGPRRRPRGDGPDRHERRGRRRQRARRRPDRLELRGRRQRPARHRLRPRFAHRGNRRRRRGPGDADRRGARRADHGRQGRAEPLGRGRRLERDGVRGRERRRPDHDEPRLAALLEPRPRDLAPQQREHDRDGDDHDRRRGERGRRQRARQRPHPRRRPVRDHDRRDRPQRRRGLLHLARPDHLDRRARVRRLPVPARADQARRLGPRDRHRVVQLLQRLHDDVRDLDGHAPRRRRRGADAGRRPLPDARRDGGDPRGDLDRPRPAREGQHLRRRPRRRVRRRDRGQRQAALLRAPSRRLGPGPRQRRPLARSGRSRDPLRDREERRHRPHASPGSRPSWSPRRPGWWCWTTTPPTRISLPARRASRTARRSRSRSRPRASPTPGCGWMSTTPPGAARAAASSCASARPSRPSSSPTTASRTAAGPPAAPRPTAAGSAASRSRRPATGRSRTRARTPARRAPAPGSPATPATRQRRRRRRRRGDAHLARARRLGLRLADLLLRALVLPRGAPVLPAGAVVPGRGLLERRLELDRSWRR